MSTPEDFFTAESVAQLTGAVTLVTAVSVTARRLTHQNSPWIPFGLSVLVTYLGAGASGTLQNVPIRLFPSQEAFQLLLGWLLPFANACLLFTAVVGVTEAAHAASTTDEIRKRTPKKTPRKQTLEDHLHRTANDRPKPRPGDQLNIDSDDDLLRESEPVFKWEHTIQSDNADADQHAFKPAEAPPLTHPDTIDFDALIGDLAPTPQSPSAPLRPTARDPFADPFADLDDPFASPAEKPSQSGPPPIQDNISSGSNLTAADGQQESLFKSWFR